MKSKLYSPPPPPPVKMTRIISVYIIFAFLLTSFAGCGKLKSSPVSGLNQSETSTPPEVVNQPEASISSETVSQPDISNEVEPLQQPEISQADNPDYLNTSQSPQFPDPSELIQDPQISPSAQMPEPSNALNKNLNQDNILIPTPVPLDNSSKINTKDLTKKESWKEWICRQLNGNKWYWIGGVVVIVGADIYYRRRSEAFRLSEQRRRSMEERQCLLSEIGSLGSLREQRRHLTEATKCLTEKISPLVKERQSLSGVEATKHLTEKILPLVKERQSLSDESQRLTEKIAFLEEQKQRLLGAI